MKQLQKAFVGVVLLAVAGLVGLVLRSRPAYSVPSQEPTAVPAPAGDPGGETSVVRVPEPVALPQGGVVATGTRAAGSRDVPKSFCRGPERAAAGDALKAVLAAPSQGWDPCFGYREAVVAAAEHELEASR